MHKKFNLLASIFKYVVIQNNTDSDITLFVTGIQTINISSKQRMRISLVESKSYIMVVAPLRDKDENESFILTDNFLVKIGRIYYIDNDDYILGLNNYMLQK
jgi:hypothetical protein